VKKDGRSERLAVKKDGRQERLAVKKDGRQERLAVKKDGRPDRLAVAKEPQRAAAKTGVAHAGNVNYASIAVMKMTDAGFVMKWK